MIHHQHHHQQQQQQQPVMLCQEFCRRLRREQVRKLQDFSLQASSLLFAMIPKSSALFTACAFASAD